MVYFQTKNKKLAIFFWGGLGMENVDTFNGYLLQFIAILVYCMEIWYILKSFGIFSISVCCTKKDLATLITARALYLSSS
jgi:hypothetical protein